MHKFDMARAWDGAVGLIKRNSDVVLIVGGVFFFLPYLAMAMFVPEMMGGPEVTAATETGEEAFQRMLQVFSEHAWLFLLVTVLQAVGVLGLLALLTDESRPTVGEALQTGAKSLLPYIGAQILQAFAMVAIFAVPVALGAVLPALGLLLGLPAVAVILYIAIKFSLVAPVMVREKVLSPINALRRSWNLTKGNSFRLALFYILLIIALLVISGVLTLVFGALALVGGTAGTVITALLNALLNMATVIVSMSIIASVHRQLAGDTPDNISITFG
jgi:hypothetical protein